MEFLRALLGGESTAAQPLFLHNTLTNRLEEFTLAQPHARVKMYNCGPTVYGRQHIGNLSMFVFTDILRRTLEYNGYVVRQVINITDVGHLTSDADEGEDKMSKGLRAENLPLTLEHMRALAEKYTDQFQEDLRALAVCTDSIEFPRASDYIDAQIAMIRALMDKTYAYVTDDGVYFDTSLYPEYGKLGGINLGGIQAGARVKTVSGKRNSTDFALWKFDTDLGWDSPWGRGFPGWHIECSAMIHQILGEPIDIHTGGIEHIPVHHNNEIAQSTCATGVRELARYWLHRAHVQFEGGKLAKSAGNVLYLSHVIEKGFDPLALRYLFLEAHYRSSQQFSWQSLTAARQAYQTLLQCMVDGAEGSGTIPATYRKRFLERINDDLDTPGALAVMWEMVRDRSLSPGDVAAGLEDMDRVLGLDLKEYARHRIGITLYREVQLDDLPTQMRSLISERDAARTESKFDRADALRHEIELQGYKVEDAPEGTRVRRILS